MKKLAIGMLLAIGLTVVSSTYVIYEVTKETFVTETVGEHRKIVPIVEEVIVPKKEPKVVEKEVKVVRESQPKPPKKVKVDNRTSMTVLATAYAPTGNLTRTETVPTEGRTIAVDPNIIPLGTKVHIEGYGDYIAEDTGGLVKGKRIDIFFNSKRDCIEFGVKHLEIKF